MASHWSATGDGGSHVHYALVLVYDDGQDRGSDRNAGGHAASYGDEPDDGNGFDYGDGRE